MFRSARVVLRLAWWGRGPHASSPHPVSRRHPMNKKTIPLFAALAFALSGGVAFAAEEPVIEPEVQPVDPSPTESGDPIPNEPTTASATSLPSSATPAEPTFADLDTDADGFVSEADLPAEHELSLQFAVAD